jgi:hypothetical protein
MQGGCPVLHVPLIANKKVGEIDSGLVLLDASEGGTMVI